MLVKKNKRRQTASPVFHLPRRAHSKPMPPKAFSSGWLPVRVSLLLRTLLGDAEVYVYRFFDKVDIVVFHTENVLAMRGWKLRSSAARRRQSVSTSWPAMIAAQARAAIAAAGHQSAANGHRALGTLTSCGGDTSRVSCGLVFDGRTCAHRRWAAGSVSSTPHVWLHLSPAAPTGSQRPERNTLHSCA